MALAQWQQDVLSRLTDRNVAYGAWKDIVGRTNQLASDKRELLLQRTGLEYKVDELKVQTTTLSRELRNASRVEIDAAREAALQAKISQLQEELSVQYREKADRATRILELERRAKSDTEEIRDKTQRVSDLETRVAAQETEATRAAESVAHLRDTVAVYETEVRKLEARFDQTQHERDQILDQYLRKVEDEATRMNRLVEIEDELRKRKDEAERLRAELAAAVEGARRGVPAAAAADDEALRAMSTLTSDERAAAVGIVRVPRGPYKTFNAHEVEGYCAAYSHSGGDWLVTGGNDKVTRVFDARGNEKTVLRGARGSVFCVDFSPSDEVVIGASADQAIYVWQRSTGKEQCSLTGHSAKVLGACFSGSDTVVSGAHDRTIRVWDLTRESCVRNIPCASSCNDVAANVDGSLIGTAHVDKKVRFWDCRSGAEAITIDRDVHQNAVTCVKFSPDGYYLLTCSPDSSLCIIDFRMGEVTYRLQDPGFQIASQYARSCFSPDGQFVAAGSRKGEIYIWDVLTGAHHSTLPRIHDKPTCCVTWRAVGRSMIAACAKDGVVTLYE